MNAPLHSPLVAGAVADIREYLLLLEYLAKANLADSKSVLNAVSMIHDAVNEIEQVAAAVPDLNAATALPVLTLADIASGEKWSDIAKSKRQPAFAVIEGGRS